ncbi:MAG: hypothetical protein U0353_08560 [Sandaracinus sp.]
MRTRGGWALLSVLLWLGCDGTVAPIDAGRSEVDAPDGASLDAFSVDDGGSHDVGSLDVGTEDVGSSDVGTEDVGTEDGSTLEAGSVEDAGSSLEAGSMDVGSSDAGGVFDAARDAPAPMDASLDTAADAAVTTCLVLVSPAVASTAESFVVTLGSNGTSCTLRIDGSSLAVPCAITTEVMGSLLSVGTHTLELLVGDGPAGPAMCASTVEITPGPDAGPVDAGPRVTTCSLAISPPGATSDDELTLDAASNGSACEIAVDGGARLSVPCTFSYASRLPAGDHVVVLYVGSGPTGPTSCMASATIAEAPDAGPRDAGPAGTATCAIDISPPTGTVASTFALTWAASGTTCSLRFDGTAPLSVPCTATTTASGSTLGPGTHTLELLVSAGPGGPTSCEDTVTVTP